jgi:hypothetical protein
MALVAMWPPANGAENAISFDGRTYSSTPGNSIEVQDFDVPVLQANGWTTFPTIAGQNYVPMTSPASGLFDTISFDGRSYTTTPGVAMNVPFFDAPILQANGWTPVSSITLQTLSLSANTFSSGAAQSTLIGNILNATPGSTIAVFSQSNSGALQVTGTQLQVGPTPPIGANSLTVVLQETLSLATNSPNPTGPLGVTENAAGAMFNSAAYSAYIAAVAA